MSLRRRHELRMLGMMLTALASIGAALHMTGLRWQHTESLPRGLYHLERDAPIHRGSIVLWCLDSVRGRWARDRGYLTRGSCPGGVEALGKVVLGVAGDTIDWSPRGVLLNGRPVPNTAPVLRDRTGHPVIPMSFGRYVVAPNALWLFSPYSRRSLDSRYFGTVPRTWVSAVLAPVSVASRTWP
jgi:conjugative transfer signal peptidase TraF